MEQWDKDYIDFVVPGHITLKKGGSGRFQFGTVDGETDYRIEKVERTERLEFSWEGFAETDHACGKGWAVIEESRLHGRLFFHLGDDSWFKAEKE